MEYSYTRAADPLARGKSPHHLYAWEDSRTTIKDLINWAYVNGMAFCTGIYDLTANLESGERTHRNLRLWRGAELLLIDLDRVDGWSLTDIINDPFVQRHAGAAFPSSSYSENNVKAHILFPLKERITEAAQYRGVIRWVMSQLSFPADPATSNPTLPTFGTVFTHPDMKKFPKSTEDGLCWINDNPDPLDPPITFSSDVEDSHVSSDISRRARKHAESRPDQRTPVVLDALKYALDKEWGEQDRDERLKLIMAAYQGSSDYAVMEAFLDYSSPRWDSSKQRASLPTWWEHHTPREGGLTIATLFAFARANGWLRTSSIELRDYQEIHYEEISDFLLLEDLPDRVLLKSQTGTGKTNGAIALLKKMQAEKEVKAIFFSPSIKLCHALSAALTRSGVENTLYIDGNKTKDGDTLREAQVLVTTLQTFAVKAYGSGVDVKSYDLVILDECDELLSAFVRSGISGKLAAPSHVDKNQARLGVEALSDLFKYAGRILMLDGTMTDLSRYIALSWSEDHSVGIYVNTFTREKAPVTIYGNVQVIRDEIIQRVAAGAKTVIACDTKAEANLIEKILFLTEAVKPDELIRITGDTASDPRVMAFFDDVEQGAKDYRVVIYNSAMGSGVSILETTPDLFYLIAEYLTPRKLLQMLNRYRVQTEVRAYVRHSENLYATGVQDRFKLLQDAARAEEILIGLNRLERDPLSKVVSNAAILVATDEFEQRRSVREFFAQLLLNEGREVSYHFSEAVIYEDETKEAREMIKQAKDDIRATWRSVPPIKRGEAFPKDLDPNDIARGLLHGYITEIFPNHDKTDIEDHEIARLALSMGRYRGLIRRWLNPDYIMNTTLAELQDRRKETVAFRLYYIRVELLTLLGELFPDVHGKYDDQDMSSRAAKFNELVRDRSAAYDMIAPVEHKISAIEDEEDQEVDKAIRYARIILKSVGLSLKRSNGRRLEGEKRDRRTRVTKLEDLYNFLLLSNIGKVESVDRFNRDRFTLAHSKTKSVIKSFLKFSPVEQNEVLETMNTLDIITFPMAVKSQESARFA